ncbi:MAG: DUF928 domain-containing protein [Xenococcaceae cyanobacterium MO_188.B29]|nr:DUF928 domain-containing protein [Xenococcaceae cyanobacterium MO_188.B29]
MLFPKIGLFISIFLLSSLPTLANRSIGNYETDTDNKKTYQRRSVAGGSRSDCQSPLVDNSLTLLVPQEKAVHKTATNQPSFFFYSQAALSTPLTFTLVDLDVAEPLVEEPLYVKQPGYHQVKLPKEVKLEPNKTYFWHIAIPCANEPENFWDVLGASVEYSPISLELSNQLQVTASPQEKADIYASNGIWYDAVDLANRARSNPDYSGSWQQLLDDIELVARDVP